MAAPLPLNEPESTPSKRQRLDLGNKSHDTQCSTVNGWPTRLHCEQEVAAAWTAVKTCLYNGNCTTRAHFNSCRAMQAMCPVPVAQRYCHNHCSVCNALPGFDCCGRLLLLLIRLLLVLVRVLLLQLLLWHCTPLRRWLVPTGPAW